MIAPTQQMASTQSSPAGLNMNRAGQLGRSLDHACRAARAADDLRGQETLVLDLTKITPIVDFFVVTSGTSNRQMRAVADEVHRVLKENGSSRLGREGDHGNSWILQDYGDVVVHIFSAEARKLYDLEHLWADAPQIDWRAHCGLPPLAATPVMETTAVENVEASEDEASEDEASEDEASEDEASNHDAGDDEV